MSSVKAIWKPSWYDLDQSIVVGYEGEFFFHSERGPCPRFFNDLLSAGSHWVGRARVERVVSPTWGDILGVRTGGLDYAVYLSDGRHLRVNAEEEPGAIDGQGHLAGPDMWTMEVWLVGLREVESQLPPKHASERRRLREEHEAQLTRLLGPAPFAQ